MKNISAIDWHKIVNFEIFREIQKIEIEKFLAGSCLKQTKHREYLFHAGDSADLFYLVLEGALKLLRHSPRGEDIIVHFSVSGDVIGALLMNQSEKTQFPISAKSMGPSRIISIPKSTFKEFWQSNATVLGRMNSLLYRRMNTIQDDKTMSTSPLRVRIANLLMRHLDSNSDSPNQSLLLNLTRQEIADSLGVAVESVIRTMREWIEDGTILRPENKNAEIINVEKLLKSIEA